MRRRLTLGTMGRGWATVCALGTFALVVLLAESCSSKSPAKPSVSTPQLVLQLAGDKEYQDIVTHAPDGFCRFLAFMRDAGTDPTCSDDGRLGELQMMFCSRVYGVQKGDYLTNLQAKGIEQCVSAAVVVDGGLSWPNVTILLPQTVHQE